MSKIWHLWADHDAVLARCDAISTNHDANDDFDDHGDFFMFKSGMFNHSSLIPRSVRPSSLKWWSIKLATSVKSTFGNAILVWESLSDVEAWVAVGHRVAVDVPKAINLYLHNDDISRKAEIKLSIIPQIWGNCFKFRLFKMNFHWTVVKERNFLEKSPLASKAILKFIILELEHSKGGWTK